jgi:uncharacterized protein (TIGR02391 family)
MPKKSSAPPSVEPKQFQSVQEIDLGIAKLERRVRDLEQLDVRREDGSRGVVESDIRETIRDVFGTHSPEFTLHAHLSLWSGPMYINMDEEGIVEAREGGRIEAITTVEGLISRLREKRGDLSGGVAAPSTYFDNLNLHARILDISRDLFLDGYHWEAVFAAAKALINYVRERSGRDDLDGAPLVRAVFSRNDPILAFNELKDQTDLDEQEGMMHLFEGAVLGIRNPGGHTFPEGPEQRAIEYLSFLSLLAYRVQEAKRRPRQAKGA